MATHKELLKAEKKALNKLFVGNFPMLGKKLMNLINYKKRSWSTLIMGIAKIEQL